MVIYKLFISFKCGILVIFKIMKKIFLIYGHYDDKSFNAAIRDTFINTAKEKGH